MENIVAADSNTSLVAPKFDFKHLIDADVCFFESVFAFVAAGENRTMHIYER